MSQDDLGSPEPEPDFYNEVQPPFWYRLFGGLWNRTAESGDDLESGDDPYEAGPASVSGRLMGAVATLFEWIAIPFQFASEWLSTRHWMGLLLGTPAIIVVMFPLSLMVIGRARQSSNRFEFYETLATEAFVEGEYEAADTNYRRMVQLDEANKMALYGLALTAEQLGQPGRAYALMCRVAPDDQPGHPAAHAWIASKIVEHGMPAASTPASQRLEHHLQQALRSSEHALAAHFRLTHLYELSGDFERAIPHCKVAVEESPYLYLNLAQMCARQNLAAEAEFAATQASDFHRQRVDANPDRLVDRIRWAWSEVLLNKHETAEDVLLAAPSSSDDEQLRKALVMVYLSWFGAISREPSADLAMQLEVLNRALVFDPENEQALEMLANLATLDWDGAENAQATLEQAMARGVAPATVHMILGVRATIRGEMEKAVVHLELAKDDNPQMPVVLNNLAWSLAHKEEPDLQRALKVAEAAREMSDHPEMEATYATILAKLGRNREAIRHFEIAIRSLPNRRDLHDQLGDLYEQVGDKGLAEQHRKLAEP